VWASIPSCYRQNLQQRRDTEEVPRYHNSSALVNRSIRHTMTSPCLTLLCLLAAWIGFSTAFQQITNALKLMFKLPDPTPPYTAPFVLAEDVWRAKLSPEVYYVLRNAGTERPWTSELNNEKREGNFSCAGCGAELFDSDSKFSSGTGWPSFFAHKPQSIVERNDYTLGLKRTETLCSNCGGHLGHSFPDGPRPTGIRYCINGLALRFRSKSETKQSENLKKLFEE